MLNDRIIPLGLGTISPEAKERDQNLIWGSAETVPKEGIAF